MGSQTRQKSSKQSLVTRITLILVGAFWFVWIGIEDQGTTFVMLVAASLILAMAIVIIEQVFRRFPISGIRSFASFWLIGLIAGALVTPMAILLMTVKISLHNHAVPDFSPADVSQVLHTTPAWVLGALMLSTAAALYNHLRSM
jgi:hypothetical protein